MQNVGEINSNVIFKHLINLIYLNDNIQLCMRNVLFDTTEIEKL